MYHLLSHLNGLCAMIVVSYLPLLLRFSGLVVFVRSYHSESALLGLRLHLCVSYFFLSLAVQ